MMSTANNQLGRVVHYYSQINSLLSEIKPCPILLKHDVVDIPS